MKKIRIILALCLTIALCASMCACSLTDMVSGTTYNTGELKDGYSKIGVIDGVDFVVPTEMKDEAIGELEFMELALEAMDNESAMKKLEKKTFEVKTSSTYALGNYSEAFIIVAPTYLSDDLDSVESAADLEEILDVEDEADIRIGNSYFKTNLNGVIKVITPIDFEFGEDEDLSQTYEYEGYVAVIENEDGDAYVLICGSVGGEDDEAMEYVAKSLEYNGDELADYDEEDDEDGFDWEINEDDVDDEKDEDKDDNDNPPPPVEVPDEPETSEPATSTPSTTTKPSTPTTTGFGTSWKDLVISIDGVVYQFPYDYETLKSNGWVLDLAKYGKDEYILNEGDKTYSTLDLTNPKYGDAYNSFKIGCGFKNYTKGAKDITECDLWSIKVTCTSGTRVMSKYANVEIFGGLKFGSSESDVLKVFGTPDDTYEANDLGYKVFTYDVNDGIKARLEITDNFGLSSIEYHNYN